jgi:hypothetical protein
VKKIKSIQLILSENILVLSLDNYELSCIIDRADFVIVV